MNRHDDISTVFHRTLCVAKATDRHGMILNYDDMQMGRKVALVLTAPISNNYPIVDTVPAKIKEEMRELGFTDFWDYYFNAEEARKKRKEEERKSKKKRWKPF